MTLPDSIRLEAIEGCCSGTVYDQPGTSFTVGRTQASSLHVNDATVSERHGELAWVDGAWRLTDLDSSNGTAVNGTTLGPHESVNLKDGDLVRFGDSKLLVEIKMVPDETVTVEQFLEAECNRLVQRVQARAELQSSTLRKEWAAKKEELLSL